VLVDGGEAGGAREEGRGTRGGPRDEGKELTRPRGVLSQIELREAGI